MSYEGHEQHLCKNGHLWTDGYSYGEPQDPCPVCKEPSAWCNSVDDTNCYSVGEIIDWSSLLLTPEVFVVCNLGHRHTTKEATYRPPTEEELEKLQHYLEPGNSRSEAKWVLLSTLKKQ